ncbi:MAG: TIGR04283 family arsenosugar biosynthesis glycosyltransferase [Fulvivirga sp.]
MKISIIIPTLNEEGVIDQIVAFIRSSPDKYIEKEIIVADGKSSDATVMKATAAGAKIINCSRASRAAQMNCGAAAATGDVLYFLHADSFPPENFALDIANAVAQGYNSGCYRLAFDYDHWFLKFNCWFTRLNIDLIRFGDQSLFVAKEVFHKAGGFNEKLILMEDQEIISRIKKHARFKVLNKTVTTSARKYLRNGVYRLQGIFTIIYFLYFLGFSQERLVKMYKRLIK